MPAKQGAPGEGQDEGIKNQTVALFDPLSPALSRRERGRGSLWDSSDDEQIFRSADIELSD
jgi:hypothetical protein